MFLLTLPVRQWPVTWRSVTVTGAVRNLFSQNCGCVFCPPCALWALKTSPPAADRPDTLGRKTHGVRALKDSVQPGDLEGRACAQNDMVSEKTWRALGLHQEWSLGFPRAGGEGQGGVVGGLAKRQGVPNSGPARKGREKSFGFDFLT